MTLENQRLDPEGPNIAPNPARHNLVNFSESEKEKLKGFVIIGEINKEKDKLLAGPLGKAILSIPISVPIEYYKYTLVF